MNRGSDRINWILCNISEGRCTSMWFALSLHEFNSYPAFYKTIEEMPEHRIVKITTYRCINPAFAWWGLTKTAPCVVGEDYLIVDLK